MVCSLPGSSVHGILQARLWSGLPCPLLGDLPVPGLEPTSLTSPVLAGRFFFFFLPLEAPGKLYDHPYLQINKLKQKVRNFIHDNVAVLVLQLRNCVTCSCMKGISGSCPPLSSEWVGLGFLWILGGRVWTRIFQVFSVDSVVSYQKNRLDDSQSSTVPVNPSGRSGPHGGAQGAAQNLHC